MLDFIRIRNLKDQLTGRFQAGVAVKVQIKGPLKQARQNPGKLSAFRDNPNMIRLKTIAEQQNTKAFSHSATDFIGYVSADFCLCVGRKGCSHCIYPR